MLFFCKATLLAQQKICYGSITRYSVDGSENLGKGSIGSTYQWGVKEPNFKGFITSVSLDRTNDINVNWGETMPGIYHLFVIETDINGCKGLSQNYEVVILPLPYTNLSKEFICINPLSKEVERPALLDTKLLSSEYSFEWKYNNNIIGASSSINVNEIGNYLVNIQDLKTKCIATYPVSVEFSSSANAKIKVDNFFEDNQTIVISIINGIGDYEYSIDGVNFQNSPIFNVSKGGDYYLVIRDKNGCFDETLNAHIVTYPKFFTPNNDNYFDFWNIDGLTQEMEPVISIFNRYNKLLKVIRYGDVGWNGTYNNYDLPSDDYWFTIEYLNTDGIQTIYRSNFSLIR